MADKLTPQQAQAVHNRGGMLLVSAAAGSGKTKVLVDRLLEYLTDPHDPADLDEFLIITYTKAAASELRGKIAAKLTERIALDPENRHLQKQVQRLFLTKISTVHGFCGDLLREYAYRLDIPADFRVADENECKELRETVLQDMLDRVYEEETDEDFRAFVDTQGLGRDDRLVPEIVEKVYDSARCHLDPDQWLESCLKASEVEDLADAADTLWGRYLMEDLFSYLDAQIPVIAKCAEDADASLGMEKVSLTLRTTLRQLEDLRTAQSWDDIVRNRDIDYGRLTFPRKNVDAELAERIKAARNACKEGMEKKLRSFADDSVDVLEGLTQSAAGARGLVKLVKRFDRDYRQAKRSRRCLDFSDLEHMTLDLLLGKSRSGPTAAAVEIGRRFREIMVDEYQDSNGVQDAIFGALTREKQNCFMVGDVKQSIYQFRLADPGIFLEKYNTYLPAEEAEAKQGRKVMLSHNFRSGPEVIEAVNDVFRCTMSPRVGGLYYGEAEALREGVPHQKLPDPGVELYALEIREDTYAEEAAFVADKIHGMLRQGTLIRKGDEMRPVTPEDIVILLRSPGSVGHQFQKALEARGIRCTTGGSVDLLQTQEIGTLRAFLQILVNPRQDIPLIATLASPLFGFTADDLAAIRSKQRSGSVYDALANSTLPKAQHFLKTLTALRADARMYSLTQLLERVYALTRLDIIYAAMDGGEAKLSNLQTFYRLAAEFESGSLRDLGQFLDHLDAMEKKGLVGTGASGNGCVTVMSIHKSKGLEFPVVFLCGLSRQFNRESLRAQILCDKELGLGLSVVDSDARIRYPSAAKRAIAVKMAAESVSEELRVLYVALTRARDRLIMTYSAENLEKDLKELALRMDFDGGSLLCRDVVCPGEWVLLAALQHTEAGQLHALGGKPDQTHISDYPWKIVVTQAPEILEGSAIREEAARTLPESAVEQLRSALDFRYPHMEATAAPSKQTATGRKGRLKDAEAAENTAEPRQPERSWRQPSFLQAKTEGKTYGNALHAAMQYIRYENCVDVEGVKREVEALAHQGFLKPEQAQMVNCESIAAFFSTELGQKLRNGCEHIREFKFSILDDGSHYGDGLEGEKVLLQGVVDCAILEADGITVLDFKTDFVTEDTVDSRAKYYRPQVLAYADALSRIYEMPVKGKYLYFFRLNRFVEV